MSQLILTLPLALATGTPEYRYCLSQDGQSVARQGLASAALLPASGRAAGELVAVVPAQALSWQRVNLPPGVPVNGPRMRAVLEGLLEDNLLDDPGQLHFALAPGASAGASAWVAVCNRLWLKTALQALEAAGRPVARVVPELAPGAPALSLHCSGTSEAPMALIGGLPPYGAVAALPLTAQALALLPLQPSADSASPVEAAFAIGLSTEPAVAGLAEQLLGQSVPLLGAAEHALQSARTTWDLAQFDLASSGRTRAIRKAGGLLGSLLRAPQWRAARWAAVLLVLAQIIGINAWAWQQRSALVAKEDAVRNTLTIAFPKVQVVVDPVLQMERELSVLRQDAGALTPGDLEPLLAAAGSTLAAHGGAAAIDYTPAALQVRGIAPTAEEVATADSALRASGYQLTQENDSLWLRTGAKP